MILRFFAQAKYGNRVRCDWCSSARVYRFETSRWRCRRCWKSFDVFTGTLLGRYWTTLRLWYELVWCFVLGYSVRKTTRLLCVSKYASCFRVYTSIRHAILEESRKQQSRKFHGTIELDESFYGGTFKNLRKHIRREIRKKGLNKRGGEAKYRKQPVFGIFKRNGEVYLEPIPEATASILYALIRNKINIGSDVFSDTASWYNGLVGFGYVHRTVNHGKEEYVNGVVHINGLEGF